MNSFGLKVVIGTSCCIHQPIKDVSFADVFSGRPKLKSHARCVTIGQIHEFERLNCG